MKIKFDDNAVKSITIFQNLTGVNVVDCIDDEEMIYFVVLEGQYGMAVGKQGIKIKKAESVFKKPIKVFEYSKDMEGFIRNMIPDIEELDIKPEGIFVKVKPSVRAKVIGKSGKNIKIMNEFLKHLFDAGNMKIR